MMKTLMTAMMHSISDVMETMFYLPVEFGKEAVTLAQSGMDKHKDILASQLSFSGDSSGRVVLVIPRNLLSEMTENFMGESREDLEEDHLLGTLTETLNMVCGNALSRLDSKLPFELGLPKVIDASKMPASEVFTIVETIQSMMAVCVKEDGSMPR